MTIADFFPGSSASEKERQNGSFYSSSDVQLMGGPESKCRKLSVSRSRMYGDILGILGQTIWVHLGRLFGYTWAGQLGILRQAI